MDGLDSDGGVVMVILKEGLDLMGVTMTTMTFDSTSAGLCSKTEWKTKNQLSSSRSPLSSGNGKSDISNKIAM